MDDSSKLHSNKELRFVTSAEQMLPFLNGIIDETNDSDDQNESDTNESNELPSDDDSKTNNKLKTCLAPPEPTMALPNIYEEYVNFIDLSVLNPIIDAVNCQRDTLIESEMSEPCPFCFCILCVCVCVSHVHEISVN